MSVFRILSFDVGIKNLAYCILEYNIITTKYLITDWNIINLSSEVEIKKCNYNVINKTYPEGKICGKTASFTCNDSYFCKVHKKKYEKDEKNKKNIKFMKEIKKKKAVKKPLIELNKTMVKKIDEIDEIKNIDEVVIENQPSLKNPHMKSIQMMIFSYFVMRGITDPINEESTIKDIVMLSARNKLKIYDGPVIECNITDKYRKNKWLAIQYCEKMIVTQDTKYIEQYSQSKKKDDLADSFLQGVFYLNKKFKFIL